MIKRGRGRVSVRNRIGIIYEEIDRTERELRQIFRSLFLTGYAHTGFTSFDEITGKRTEKQWTMTVVDRIRPYNIKVSFGNEDRLNRACGSFVRIEEDAFYRALEKAREDKK